MKILYASFDEVPSFKGASTHILSICRRVRRRHQLELFTLGEARLPPAERFVHRPQAIAEPNYLRRGLEFRSRVARALGESSAAGQPFELAHFRGPWEGLPMIESKLPCLYEVNGLPSIELTQTYRDLPQRCLQILRGWEQQCLDGARAIVCPSPLIRRCLLERYGAHLEPKISVNPNGYEPQSPAAQKPESAGSARSGSSPLRLVYLGTLHPWQGLFFLLKAFAPLRDICTLDIFAPAHRQWDALLDKQLNRNGLSMMIRRHPPLHRAQLDARLPGFDAGLLPLLRNARNTVQGCSPIKLLDYLSHGLPVLGSDLLVVRQLIDHEYNGLLFRPNDRASFIESVRRLAADRPLLQSLRERSRSSLASWPTWDEHGDSICDLYQRALDQPGFRPAPADRRDRSAAPARQ